MGQQRWFQGILVGWMLLALSAPAWACETALQLSPPQCEPNQMVHGICFNQNMDEAVRTMRTKAFQEAINKAVQDAQAYLDTIPPGPNKLIITDLDETLVNNGKYYAAQKTFNPAAWDQWLKTNKQGGPYIQPVLELLTNAKRKGFSIMFITGRPAYQAPDTLKQVSALQWDGVYFRPMGVKVTSEQFKGDVRQMLRELGYEIVLNLGDQASDFDIPIDRAEGEFQIPNIMYFIP